MNNGSRVDRRSVIAGLAAGVALPAAGLPDLRAALDAAARDPAAGLRALAEFDAATLAGGARLDLLTARAGLAVDAALAARFPEGSPGKSPYRVTPRAGAWQTARRDAAAIDRDTAALAADRRAGVLLPRPAIDRIVAAIDRVAAEPAATAALARLRAGLAEQRSDAPDAPGLARLPGGAALYALYLSRVGSPPAAAALARLEAEGERLSARADRLFVRRGQRGGTVGARYAALWRDPRWLYADSDAGRAQAVADMRRDTAAAAARMAQAIGPTPDFCADVDVRMLSPAEIAAGRQGYRESPAPGRRGTYIVDLADIRRRPAWTLPSVVAHELLPGHMVQLGIEGLDPPHPLRLDYAGAFVEGWAIHAETLVSYPTIEAELGHVHWLLFRTVRAIVDLRLHLAQWSVAQARAAMVERLGEPAYFAPFDVELDRIALEPATRAGEAMAWLAIADAVRGTIGRDRIRRHAAILRDGRKRAPEIAAA